MSDNPSIISREWNQLIKYEIQNQPDFTTAQKYFSKNRYTNVLANEETKVTLNRSPGYINANFIHLPNDTQDQPSFIATQGPLQNTVYDFWLMVLEQQVTEIVMLANVEERFRPKCYQYWPEQGDNDLVVTEENESENNNNPSTISVSCESTERITDEVLLRRLRVSSNHDLPSPPEKVVTHLQFIGWPDHGVPENTASFRELVEQAFETKQKQENHTPIVAHCSAGIGRTGTFMTVYDAWQSLRRQMKGSDGKKQTEEEAKNENEKSMLTYNVFEVVKKIKQQRYGSVQQRSQYEFIYRMIETEANQLDVLDRLKFESCD